MRHLTASGSAHRWIQVRDTKGTSTSKQTRLPIANPFQRQADQQLRLRRDHVLSWLRDAPLRPGQSRCNVLCCALILVLGCTGQSPASLRLEAFQTAAARQVCLSLATCPPGPGPDDRVWFDSEAGCLGVSAAMGHFGLDDLARGVAAGRIAYDGTRAAECLATMAGCDTLLALDSPACRATFKGVVAGGGACTQDAECAAGGCEGTGECARCAAVLAEGAACGWSAQCGRDRGCVGGHCQALGNGTTGEPCAPDRNRGMCAADTFCDDTSGFNVAKCAAVGGAGAPCVNGAQCATGFYCGAGTCQIKSAVGNACDATRPYPTDACVPGAACVPDASGTGRCEPTVGEGVACTDPRQCRGIELTCDQGHCARLPELGKPCTGQVSQAKELGCMPPAVCVLGLCADRPARGQPCADHGTCAEGLVCAAGKPAVCADPPGLGEPCAGVCKAGLTCKSSAGAMVCVAGCG